MEWRKWNLERSLFLESRVCAEQSEWFGILGFDPIGHGRGQFWIRHNNRDGGSAELGALNNTGSLFLTGGSSIVLTAQPQGITNVNAFIELDQGSTISAAGKTPFQNLTTINGVLNLYMGKQFTVSPLGATHTLTINSSVQCDDGPGFAVNGNVLINGSVSLGGDGKPFPGSHLSATGTITNNGFARMGGYYSNGDRIQAASLVNNGTISIADFSSMLGKSLTNSGTITVTGYNASAVIGSKSPSPFFPGFQLLSDGVLHEVLAGNSQFGEIESTGGVDLSGVHDISLGAGYLPDAGRRFTLLTFEPGDLSGAFSKVVFDQGDPFSITYDNKDGEIYITSLGNSPTPEPGTFGLAGAAVAFVAWRISRSRRQ